MKILKLLKCLRHLLVMLTQGPGLLAQHCVRLHCYPHWKFEPPGKCLTFLDKIFKSANGTSAKNYCDKIISDISINQLVSNNFLKKILMPALHTLSSQEFSIKYLPY